MPGHANALTLRRAGRRLILASLLGGATLHAADLPTAAPPPSESMPAPPGLAPVPPGSET